MRRSGPSSAKEGVAIAAAIIALAGARPAAADPFAHWRATGDLALDLRASAGQAGAIEVGPGLRATAGPRWLAYTVGVDLRAGGGSHGGFAFDGALYPVGVTIFHGAPAGLRVVGGVGVGGITGHRLPIAARFPIEAALELHPVRALELSAWTEVAWALRAARDGGAPDAPFGDELVIGVTVRVGRGRRESEWHWSNGWRVGATWSERMGERAWGLVLGYGIDVAGGPID